MIIYIKNPHSTNTINYQGQDILAGEYFEIPLTRLPSWQTDSSLLVDIANGTAIVAKDDTGTSDILTINKAIDFLKGNQVSQVQNIAVDDPGGKRARLVGTHVGTAAANTSTKIDWLIPQLQFPLGTNVDSLFNGVQYYASNSNHGDSICFQIVDKNGIGVTLGLYSQGVYNSYKDAAGVFVVEQFSDSWFVAPNVLEDIILYKAILLPGLYVRVIYNNTSSTNAVDFFINIFRHIQA